MSIPFAEFFYIFLPASGIDSPIKEVYNKCMLLYTAIKYFYLATEKWCWFCLRWLCPRQQKHF